jgi:tetratricopeptide (TPR) repeat protein
LNSEYAEAWNNLGLTLFDLKRPEEAEVALRKSLKFKPVLVDGYNNLGMTFRELGRLKEAEACYRQAIGLKSDYAEAYSNLGITLQELGRLKEAEACYIQAITLKPDYGEAYNNLGLTLKELGRLEEAETNYIHAEVLKPDYAKAHFNFGVLLFESEKYDRAVEQFELSDTEQSKCYAIRCSYLQDAESTFFDKFDHLVSQCETNAILGSVGLCSEVKYGKKRSNPFCNDPFRHVVNTDLNILCDFERIFVAAADDILTGNSLSYRTQGLLNKGVQTAGNIFAQGKVPETEIEIIIRAEIEKYRIKFKDSEEGFIKRWPTSYDIQGWLICMKSGGKLAPHMHEQGWISGSIYIKVPPKSDTNSGNLVLCLGDQGHVLGTEQSIIDVVTGSFCLFPSSLHHYTVPFEGKDERIVLAFDVVPKI